MLLKLEKGGALFHLDGEAFESVGMLVDYEKGLVEKHVSTVVLRVNECGSVQFIAAPYVFV
jgi:hypothetical protein